MKIIILTLFLYFACFKTIVEADDGNTKANSERSESTRPKGERSMSYTSMMYEIDPETGEWIEVPHEPTPLDDVPAEPEYSYHPYAIPEDTVFAVGMSYSYDPETGELIGDLPADKPEVHFDDHVIHEAMYAFSDHDYPEVYLDGSGIAETMFMLGDPEVDDIKLEYGFNEPVMDYELYMTANDPYMQPYETHMSAYDTYMSHYDPYMQPHDPYMSSTHCDCPCMNYDHYDTSEYYGYDSWDYYGHSEESEIVRVVQDVGKFLPEISGYIADFRTELYDIKMMISQWDSLSALEELISSAEGISLADIFPRNTDYSIIGEEILKIMDKTKFERILDISETFFRSDEIGLLSFHLVSYEGTIPIVEHLIGEFQQTGIMGTFIEMFGEITWLRKATMMMKDMPWMKALIDGVGKILRIEDYLYELCSMAIEIEKARFGGCNESAILLRCVDETFSSIETVQVFIGALDPYTIYEMNHDSDEARLKLLGCFLTDTLCREHSVDILTEQIRPMYEFGLDCYSYAMNQCNEAEYESTTDYLRCYQESCG